MCSAWWIMFSYLLVAPKVCLPAMNPIWSCTNLGIMVEMQQAFIFAYSLIFELRRKIGLKLAGVSQSFLGLGRVMMCVLNISEGKEACSVAVFYNLVSCGAMQSPNTWWYLLVNPSGPGDLPLGKILLTQSTTWSVKGQSCSIRSDGAMDWRWSRKAEIADGFGWEVSRSTDKLYSEP